MAASVKADKRILVLGTGVIGLSAAHALQSAGYQVTLYSKEGFGSGLPTSSPDHTSNYLAPMPCGGR